MLGDVVIIPVARSLKVRWTHPLVAVIKGRFVQNIDILCVSDIMAYSQISVDNVVSHILEDEDSFDDSDSETGEDILLLCHALNLKKSHALTGGAEEAENPLSSEDELANNKQPLEDDLCDTNIEQTNYSTVEDDSSNECDAIAMELTNPSTDFAGNEGDTTGSILPTLESLSQHSNEVNDMEVVSERA